MCGASAPWPFVPGLPVAADRGAQGPSVPGAAREPPRSRSRGQGTEQSQPRPPLGQQGRRDHVCKGALAPCAWLGIHLNVCVSCAGHVREDKVLGRKDATPTALASTRAPGPGADMRQPVLLSVSWRAAPSIASHSTSTRLECLEVTTTQGGHWAASQAARGETRSPTGASEAEAVTRRRGASPLTQPPWDTSALKTRVA